MACFSGRSDRQNPLLSPCACSGSQNFIHRRCLQACQIAGFGTFRREQCGVCLQRYSEQLNVPGPPVLSAGDLLVASHSLSGTFKSSVILMCEFGRRVLGVVISKECPRPPAFPDLPKTRFFIGGPVCGGRYGVVQYLVCVICSSVTLNFPKVILSPTHAESPENPDTINTSEGERKYLCIKSEWKMEDESTVPNTARQAAEDPTTLAVLVFKGYCAWGDEQLKTEFGRGMWGFTKGSVDDFGFLQQAPSSASAENLDAVNTRSQPSSLVELASSSPPQPEIAAAGTRAASRSPEGSAEVPQSVLPFIHRFYRALSRHQAVLGQAQDGPVEPATTLPTWSQEGQEVGVMWDTLNSESRRVTWPAASAIQLFHEQQQQ